MSKETLRKTSNQEGKMSETRIDIDGSKLNADIQNKILENTLTTVKNIILDANKGTAVIAFREKGKDRLTIEATGSVKDIAFIGKSIILSMYQKEQKSDPDFAAALALHVVKEILRDIRTGNIDIELNEMAELLTKICLRIIAKVAGENK